MDRIRLIGSPLYQWEIGRKIEITPSPHTRVDKVEFSHPGDANTLSLVPREENGVLVADIPNVLLQSGNIIFVYLVHAPDGGVETTTDHILSVIRRPKPADYVYTEDEVLTYHALDKRLQELEGEGLANAVADYLKENPIEAGATKEEAAQIKQNKTDIEQLTQDKLDASKLPEAVNDALAQAKASGEFKGDPGEPGKTPEKGKDYFTDADKQEIAELAADMVEIPESGNIELDTTLTVSGKAADAKSVGDALDGKIPNRGTEERPYYNDFQLALLDDVPTDATLEHFIGNALTQYDASIKQHIEGVTNGAWNQATEYVDTAIGNLDIPTDDHINDLINTALSAIPNAAEVAY